MNTAPRLLLTAWVCGFVLCEARSEPKAISRVAVESSSIASFGYGRASKLLEIEFRSGAIYRYRDVPKKVFKAFSQGGWWNLEQKIAKLKLVIGW